MNWNAHYRSRGSLRFSVYVISRNRTKVSYHFGDEEAVYEQDPIQFDRLYVEAR